MITDVLPIGVFWSLLCALSVAPVGYMLGSSCSPCCGPQGCGVADGKPRTDPATEGHWVPSGTWATGVTWTFSSSPSATDGGTWYFYGSAATSKAGGSATLAEQRDWANICNWYSNKTTTPSSTSSLTTVLDKRATRLPPVDSIVHIYSSVNTTSAGPVTVKNAYFWAGAFGDASEMTTTSGAHDSIGGCVLNEFSLNGQGSVINGGATLNGSSGNNGASVINGGATFNGSASNSGTGSTVNGGAAFNDQSTNRLSAVINGGATFNENSGNYQSAVVNGGATFNDSANNSFSGIVNDGATFNDGSGNSGSGVVNGGAVFNGTAVNISSATVNDGATFNDSSVNYGLGGAATVNGGAVFNGTSYNAPFAVVNGGATFNDSSSNRVDGTVNDGATFNDAACSFRTVGSFANCPGAGKRIFVAHPTDLPTCNGTAPAGCDNAADTCGCG